MNSKTRQLLHEVDLRYLGCRYGLTRRAENAPKGRAKPVIQKLRPTIPSYFFPRFDDSALYQFTIVVYTRVGNYEVAPELNPILTNINGSVRIHD